MTKKKSKGKKDSKKALETKQPKGKQKAEKPEPKAPKRAAAKPAFKAPKAKKAKPAAELVRLPAVQPELEALDEVERAALEEYQRAVAENRARKEEAQPVEVIDADGWQFDMSSSTFSLQRENETVAELTLDEQSMRALVEGLNGAYILPEDEPPSYQVRIPDLYSAPPVLSLIKGGAVIGSLAMNEEFNENVGPILQARYPEKAEEPAWTRFKAWMKAHKVRTVLLALLATPVLILLVQGAYNSILASFA